MPESAAPADTSNPLMTVRRFLTAMAAGDRDGALALMGDRIVYTNVGLATLRGRRKAGRVIDLLARPGLGFGVHIISDAAEGDTVLTERIDEIIIGPLRMRFWVCGKFVVDDDGSIVVWRDYFDFFDCTKAFLRAVVGVVAPSLNRSMPA